MALSMDGLIRPRPMPFSRGLAALPAAAPLALPIQSLHHAPPAPRAPLASSPPGVVWRRVLVIGSAVALVVAATHEMALVLNGAAVSAPEVIMLALFVLLFGWISLAFTSALAGFAVLLRGHAALPNEGPPPVLHSRTALLFPIYNEQPAQVFSAIEAMRTSLMQTGATEAFDFFVLSDTTDPDTWVTEEAHFLALRGRMAGAPHVYYRRRKVNAERKVGNIGEWISRFGAAYDHFVVLDADSLMEGALLVQLAAMMERHRGIGLIQTLPVSVRGETMFARLQQFAGRAHGVLVAAGLAWWQGAEGNYYGHNAIIRTRAFAGAAGLPHLAGRKPFGGAILSHDFVEAALLRRAGWAVHMWPTAQGSFEQGPPNLIDHAVRDRRWCQGNLQHAAVLPAAGLHPISRLHLLSGIGAYLTAPLWLAFLLGGIVLSLQAHFSNPVYFPAGHTLFPHWPVIDPLRAKWMFFGTMLLLLLPKFLGVIAFLANRTDRRTAGGVGRVVASLALEIVVSGLLAPVSMLTQARQVASILAGRDAGWAAQRRDHQGISWRDAAARYWWHTAIGLCLGCTWFLSPALALWMAPVVLGLVLSIPLVVLTGSAAVGRAVRRAGLLTTPEEAAPSSVLRAAAMPPRGRFGPPMAPAEAVARLAQDTALLTLHRRLLPPRARQGAGRIDLALATGMAKLTAARDLATALALLERQEKAALLASPAGLTKLVALARRSGHAPAQTVHATHPPQPAHADA